MNRIAIYFIIGLLIVGITGFLTPADYKDYKEQWKEVEQFTKKGLPRSAIKIVDEIYKEAKREGNEPQLIKSLIYRISLQSQFEEEHLENAIYTFEKELETARVPENQILHSLVAELYQWYYQQNRWQINERGIVIDFEQKDISTWDAVMINKKIRNHYLESILNHDQIANIELEDFDAILNVEDKNGLTLWPSLYDLLGNRVLDYFLTSESGLADIGSLKLMNSNNLLASAEEFVQMKFTDIDSTSATFIVLKLYQRILDFHLQAENTEALVDLDLKRLQYVLNNAEPSNQTTEKYIKSIESLREKYRSNPVFSKLSATLARKHVEKGNQFNETKSEDDRLALNKAVQICNEALDAFPDIKYGESCKKIIEEINMTEFDFQIENAVYPEQPFLNFISYRNIDKLYFKIVKLDPDELLETKNGEERARKIKRYLSNATVLKWFQKLPDAGDHQKYTTEAIVPALESGYYMLFASTEESFESENLIYRPIWVTKLSYISKNNTADGSVEVFILDRESGNAIEGIQITAYEKRYNPKIRNNEYLHAGDFISDKSGYAKLTFDGKVKNNSVSFMMEKDCEKLFSENDFYVYKKANDSKRQTKIYLFTDRAIYRPGQTVYFKGIVVDEDGNEVSLKSDYLIEVIFRNVNRKVVSTTNLTSNKFGSIQGAFVIPKGGLNGQMTIKTKYGAVNFLVEEYKRPTFQVIFDTLKGEYKTGDEITVAGKAENYTGSSVINATVKYRVVRSQLIMPYDYRSSFYRPYPYVQPKEIANGKISTNEKGEFEITFTAEPDNNTFNWKEMPSQFTIYADVTDVTGEVQSSNANVNVGKDALMLGIEVPDKMLKETSKGISIQAMNASGAPVNTNIDYALYKLASPDKLFVNRYWSKPDTIIIGNDEFSEKFPHLEYKNENEKEAWTKQLVSSNKAEVNGSKTILAETLKSAEIGEYFILAKAITLSGDTIQSKRFFTLFSAQSKKLPGKPVEWFNISNQKAEPGEILQLAIGSAAKKSKIFYEIVNGNEVIENSWVTLSAGQKFIEIPVKESYRGNFTINLSMVRFNRQYSQSFVIEVPFTNKKLDISLETFRDYLTPGAKEEWRITISGPEGEKLAAELMAGMYDASLDQFRSNSWNLNLYQAKRNDSKWTSGYFNSGWAYDLNPQRPHPIYEDQVRYPAINWFGYLHYSSGHLMRTDVMLQKAGPAEGGLEEVVLDENAVELEEKTDIIPDEEQSKEEQSGLAGKPRTNFNETAFFYPQIQTDSLGNAVFSFTTPDALTEWKIMMLAQSKDLKVGTLEEKIKARKELMIIPNLPRFVRQGDQLVFTAKVVNYTDEEIRPVTDIQFFNPLNDKTVFIFKKKNNEKQNLLIKPKQSALVSWEIVIPSDLDMLAYRISAKAENYTDSEERVIPVLTNRMLVTETIPMPVNGGETRSFSFDKLLISDKIMAVSTSRNYRYTIEFTSNPAWYAVQALPYLSEPKMENASNLFQRYYANSLSSFIINSNPKIKTVFESWKNLTPDAFYSNLQKNEELKNVLLNATPWVLEAENETEQKRRLGILFDINQIANEKSNTLVKLSASQLSNGAWPWFKGMREDRHTTQQIMLGVGKLLSKQVIDLSEDRDLKNMTRKAVKYIDERILEDYEKLKKNNPKGMKDNQLGTLQIEYLYARSLLLNDFPIPSKLQTAFDYYFGQAKKFWLKKSNYLQGMIALTMYRFDNRNEAEGIMRSLKERALHDNEMGMYWRQEVSWRWYEAPVETQAMLIQAFEKIQNDPKSVEQMKIWLLKQKQTTHWKTTGATADAVYALLLTGQNLLSEDKLVEVKVGDKKIIPKEIEGMKVEAGTGYFKTSWKGEEIKADMGKIEVTNPNNSISWGGAYWQYFEQLDRITAHDSPLSVEKIMFIEELTEEGPVIRPMEDGQKLKPGDKVIVRLVIGTDRNMEYVHLKDMRASALEPMEQLSGYSYKGGLGFYKNVTDVSTEFFIQYLNKGTYVLEYPLMVTQKGEFSNGIATIQSYYAPEFAAHSEGKRLLVR